MNRIIKDVYFDHTNANGGGGSSSTSSKRRRLPPHYRIRRDKLEALQFARDNLDEARPDYKERLDEFDHYEKNLNELIEFYDTILDDTGQEFVARRAEYEYPANQLGNVTQIYIQQLPIEPIVQSLAIDGRAGLEMPVVSIDMRFKLGQNLDDSFTEEQLERYAGHMIARKFKDAQGNELLYDQLTRAQRMAVPRYFRDSRWAVLVRRPGVVAIPFTENAAFNSDTLFSDAPNNIKQGDVATFVSKYKDANFTLESYPAVPDFFDEGMEFLDYRNVFQPLELPGGRWFGGNWSVGSVFIEQKREEDGDDDDTEVMTQDDDDDETEGATQDPE